MPVAVLLILNIKTNNTMKQWELKEVPDSGLAITEEGEVVMYADDLNREVLAKIVEMHNAGKDSAEIDAYLLDEEKCTQDEREFIMENIINYIKLTNVSDTNSEVLQPGTDGGQASQTGNDSGPLSQPAAQQPGASPEPPVVLSPQQRAANTRKANLEKNGGAAGTRRLTDGPAKKPSTSKAIEEFQEKIDLLKVLDGAELLVIPSGLSVTGRNLLIEFQKEQDALVQKYIDLVKTS